MTGTAFLAGFSYSSDYYEDSWTFFLATTGFWTGDFAFKAGDFAFWTVLAGATSSDSYSSDDSTLAACFLATGFCTGDLALRAGDVALVAGLVTLALTGASSDSDYYEDSWTFFLGGTTGFCAGDLAFTTFLGGSYSLSSYSEDSFLTTFLGAKTGFWTGDLAFTTFLGGSYSLSSYDDSCLAGFLATGVTFLAGAVSVLTCLTGFF